MPQPKKLIEVAMPIKEISAESVRDKSIRHGHISTLHLWWARRPLPVCRAVVFASLVPDPLDEYCPQAFRDAVELLLGKANNIGDPYSTYRDIPWTSVYDPMADNLRNRLQMFIGKFTEEMQQHLLHHKPKPGANNQLTDNSLIKWDNKNNGSIVSKARKLIWVAHNARTKKSAETLLKDFDKAYKAIEKAEEDLYSIADRHIATEAVAAGEAALKNAIEAFLDKMPKVFDPFAGGGAIPLEAARLGCRTFGNDINPVAHIIQKGSLEFPQKYGKPITFTKDNFEKVYGRAELVRWCKENGKHADAENLKVEISNRLSFDVAFYAKKLLAETDKDLGHMYPADINGNRPIAYYWARTGTCSNPSCKAEVPLLKGFYLANAGDKQIYLNPIINGKHIDFEIKYGKCNLDGWVIKNNLSCPVCHNATQSKELQYQYRNGKLRERLLAVIYETTNGKEYRTPTIAELQKISNDTNLVETSFYPSEKLPTSFTGGSIVSWGASVWGDMFSQRQLLALKTFIQNLQSIKSQLQPNQNDYTKAIITYLGILVDRIAVNLTSFGLWKPSGEFLSSVFSKQAIPMVFDYPESNPFCDSTGSFLNQLDWILRYIHSESAEIFPTTLNNSSSGDKAQFSDKSIMAVITDPPYYDAIAYADLSDFFYVWLKRTLGDLYPTNFATPQTPKTEECTALKHHHDNSRTKANSHFENKLTQIFDSIEHQTSDIVSIMFAHQSTEAWTTLCNSILKARMNITGSWPMDSERGVRGIALAGAALESSVTVSCRPAQRVGLGGYREVKIAIENTITLEVEKLYGLGFRGADLLTACFGQAVSEFGRYEKVERADGNDVTVAELLAIARESAFNALLKGFDGDDFTKFYIGWLQLNGFEETDHGELNTLVKVGLSIETSQLFKEHILIQNGNKQTLGGFEGRIKANKNLGDRTNNLLIDEVHRAMALYKGNNRIALLQYISKVAFQPENSFWRVLTSLCEVLPAGSEDQKQALGLLTNKSSLIRESKAAQRPVTEQTNLFGQ